MGNIRSRPSAETVHRLHMLAITLTTLAAIRIIGAKIRSDGSALQQLNQSLRSVEPLHVIILTLLFKYLLKNVGWLLGINAPITEHNYRLSYEFASRFVVALDAGYFSAINIRPFWLRDLISLNLSLYYFVFIEQGMDKTRRFRKVADIKTLRFSWEKTTESGILSFITGLTTPPISIKKPLSLHRSSLSGEALAPVSAILFFDGTNDQLSESDEVILHVHGGGFMSMSPIHHQEYLILWAKQTRKPILAINYQKAPEFPYPYALNEVFDVYRELIKTEGRLIGLNGERPLRVIIGGDSAGGNLSAATILKILGEQDLRVPDGLFMIYPVLNLNAGFWTQLTDPSGVKEEGHKLQISSVVRYIEDRIIDASILTASANAYLSEQCSPGTDMCISPLIAPDEVLARFPPVFINVGNRDPLYDDSVVFAARLERINAGKANAVTLDVVEGFSHGYLQMLALVPEAHRIVEKVGTWIVDTFNTGATATKANWIV